MQKKICMLLFVVVLFIGVTFADTNMFGKIVSGTLEQLAR